MDITKKELQVAYEAAQEFSTTHIHNRYKDQEDRL